MLRMSMEQPETLDSIELEIPAEVELVMSALETVRHRAVDRRGARRNRYRVPARLRLFSDRPEIEPRTIYTRDIHPRGVGFISPDRLPLGHGGLIQFPLPDGGLASLHCTLCRCRQTANGWFEGSLNFNVERKEFDTIFDADVPAGIVASQ
jgi:hypothetical protein